MELVLALEGEGAELHGGVGGVLQGLEEGPVAVQRQVQLPVPVDLHHILGQI